jgi:hypothetical protein
MPLSIEKESEGNPFKFQCLIVTGSPNTCYNENIVDWFNLNVLSSYYHALIVVTLYPLVNAPKYDIIAEHNSISPTRFLYCFYKLITVSAHLFYSPPSPVNSVYALSSFLEQSSISSYSFCFFLAVSLN